MVVGFTRKDFLEALFAEYFQKHDGFIVVKCFRNLDRNWSLSYFPNVEVLSRQQYRDSENVFFGVCPREAMKPEPQYAQYASAIWAGLDLSSDGHSGKTMFFNSLSHAAKAVRSFPLPPSIIVESGWGMHLYWLFKEVLEVTDEGQFERQLAKVNSYFQCTSDVKIDSLLRLPGTLNSKRPSRGVNCNVKFINTDFRYELKDFEKLSLGEDAFAAAANPAVPLDKSADEAAEIDAKEIEEFLSRESEQVRQPGSVAANPEPLPPVTSPPSAKNAKALTGEAFDPVSYEPRDLQFASDAGGPVEETVSVMVETASVGFEDVVAEKIAQRVAEILSEGFLDDLADKVVEKLIRRTKRGSAAKVPSSE
jgi:hypothetical protein